MYKKINQVLLHLLLFMLTLNIASIVLLRHYDLFYRTIPVKDFNTLEYTYFCESPVELTQFIGSSPVEIMQNVMNFVDQKRVGSPRSDTIKDIYEHAKTGGGLNCNGMAELFLHALRLQGYKARKVFVVKSLGDPYVTHTLVEVYQEGRWVVYDPTFNSSFKKEGIVLGAVDVAHALLDGSCIKIKPVFYGEVAYKARLETYPFYWLAHFNHVLIFQPGHSAWSKLIGLRYWYGPILYYFSFTGQPNSHLIALDWIYFFSICLGPFLWLSLAAVIGLIFLSKNKHLSSFFSFL